MWEPWASEGGGGAKAALDFENWHFPIKFAAKKGCFFSFEWLKWNFSTFWPPLAKSFRLPLENPRPWWECSQQRFSKQGRIYQILLPTDSRCCSGLHLQLLDISNKSPVFLLSTSACYCIDYIGRCDHAPRSMPRVMWHAYFRRSRAARRSSRLRGRFCFRPALAERKCVLVVRIRL